MLLLYSICNDSSKGKYLLTRCGLWFTVGEEKGHAETNCQSNHNISIPQMSASALAKSKISLANQFLAAMMIAL